MPASPQINPDGYINLTPDGYVLLAEEGEPCCCGPGNVGPCCAQTHGLPRVCAEEGGTEPGTCCSCGLRWRKHLVIAGDYGVTAQRTGVFAGSFSFSVRITADITWACDPVTGQPAIVAVEAANLQVLGHAQDDVLGLIVDIGYSSSDRPNGWTLEEFLAFLTAYPSLTCASGIVDANGSGYRAVEAAMELLLARVSEQAPGMSWATEPGVYLRPNNGRGVGRSLSLLGTNREACVIGYEPGIRCNCPRSYAYVFPGRVPDTAFYFGNSGYLINPTIGWSGSQACRAANYSATNGGTLYIDQGLGGGLEVSGTVGASLDASIGTTVLEACPVDPCAGQGAGDAGCAGCGQGPGF